jgi:hypothetical protein
MKRDLAIIATLALVALLVPLRGFAQSGADQWQFSVTPYLWLPSLDGTLRYGPPAVGGASPNVSVDADTLLGALDFAFMGAAEARKGRWSVMTDFIYLDLSVDKGGVRSVDFNPGPGPVNVSNTSANLGLTTSLKGRVWSMMGGYSIVYQPRHTMDIVGGFRYLDITTTTDWRLSAAVAGPAGTQNFATAGSVTKSEDILDAVVGIRGRAKVGDGNWFVPYHLDVGGGDSKLTWQGVLGVGYSFKWGDLLFGYRYLSYEQDGTKLVEDLKFGGFGAGLTFRF